MNLNQEISYKELCQEFNELPAKGSKSKELQLNRFNKTHVVEKIGRNKYIIKKEKTPEEIQYESDKKHYSKYLQNILLNMIADNESQTMVFTYRQIRENLMMVNAKYFPVKYHKDNIEYVLPYDYDPIFMDEFERQWFDIADRHDEATIKYALKALKDKHLITTLQETYIFYKFEKDENGNTIFHRPVVANERQLAEINQRQLDFIKMYISEEQIQEIEKNNGPEHFFGACLRELFKKGKNVMKDYYGILFKYTEELGFTRYARGFKITRPTELKKIVGYYAPSFNEYQVDRFLNSTRFKTIPPFVHEQLTNKLIKRGL